MTTAVATRSRLAAAPIPRITAAQVKGNLLGYYRQPAFFVFSIGLPVMFFLFFGLPFAHDRLPDGTLAGTQIMANLGAYAVSSVLVFNVGIQRAQSRAQKLDLLQRATPLPGWVVIIADALSASVMALASLVVLFGFAAVAGGVRLDSPEAWVLLIARQIVGALPLLGLGLAIGYGAGPTAAPALANLIYLPLSFASGLFIPLQELPDFIQKAAPYLPTYHYAEFVRYGVTRVDEPLGTAVLWLAGWAVVLFAAAIRFYRRDQARKFS